MIDYRSDPKKNVKILFFCVRKLNKNYNHNTQNRNKFTLKYFLKKK